MPTHPRLLHLRPVQPRQSLATLTVPAPGTALAPGTVLVHPYANPQPLDTRRVRFTADAISFIEAGRKVVLLAAGAIAADAGDFLFFRKGNCLMTEVAGEGGGDYRSTMIFLGEGVLAGFAAKYASLLPAAASAQAAHRYRHDAQTRRLLEEFKAMAEAPAGIRAALRQLRLEELLLRLSTRVDEPFSGFAEAPPSPDALTTVVERYALSKLSVADLAHLCHVSVATFKRRFGERYGEPPATYFRRRRLAHAADLLRAGRVRPSEVYETAGFATASGFAQAFREEFGTSPSAYATRV